MSSLRRHYERDDYFARLVKLNGDPNARKARDRALISVLQGIPSGLDVLDAGCGLGGFSEPLRATNRMTGVDVNEHCLAEIALAGYDTRHFDLEEEWPVAPASFDLILFGDVLEHLFATIDVLSQAKRALRENGAIAVAVPNIGYWRRRLRLFLTGDLTIEMQDHIRFFSPRTLARVAERAGLEVVGNRPYAWNRESARGLPVTLAWGFITLLRSQSR